MLDLLSKLITIPYQNKEYIILSHEVKTENQSQLVCLIRFNFETKDILTISLLTIPAPLSFRLPTECSKWFSSKRNLSVFLVHLIFVLDND